MARWPGQSTSSERECPLSTTRTVSHGVSCMHNGSHQWQSATLLRFTKLSLCLTKLCALFVVYALPACPCQLAIACLTCLLHLHSSRVHSFTVRSNFANDTSYFPGVAASRSQVDDQFVSLNRDLPLATKASRRRWSAQRAVPLLQMHSTSISVVVEE